MALRISAVSTPAFVFIATICALTYVLLLGGAYPGVFAPSFRLLDAAVAAIALFFWAIVSVVRPNWRPRSSLWPLILASLAAFLTATITSELQRISIEYILYAVVLWGSYLLLVRLQADSRIGPRIGAIAVVLLIVVAALYLRTTIANWLVWWSIVGHIAMPPLRPGFESLAFGNPSALGAVAFLTFVAGAAHLQGSSRASQAAIGALGVLTLCVCLITGARSVWVGLAASAAVLLGVALGSAATRSRVATAVRSRRQRGGALLTIAALAAIAIVTAPAVLVRAGFGDPYRPGYWAASVRMFQDAALTGHGPGLWSIERANYTLPTELDFYIPHAHNVYLQTAAELGLVGLVAGAVGALVLARLIRRSMGGGAEQRAYAWAAIAGLGYLAGHQTVDVVTNLPAVLLALGFVISRLDALDSPPQSPGVARASAGANRPRSRFVGIAPPFVAAACAASLVWVTSTAVAHGDAVEAAGRGNWQMAVDRAAQVVSADPDIPAYHVTLAIASARTGQSEAAAQHFRQATLVDSWPQGYVYQAAIHQGAGEMALAHSALDSALRLGIQQPSIALQSAVLWTRLGEADRAAEALAMAFSKAPSIAADAWWTGRTEMANARAAALDQVIQSRTESAFRVALEVGRMEDAENIAAVLEGIDPYAQLVFAAWSGSDDARAELRAWADRRPLDLRVVSWNAIVADHTRDTDSRDRYRLWADLINGGAGSEAVGFEIVDRLPAGRVPTGTLGLSYGQFLYLRPVPTDQVAMGLPQLIYR